MLGEYILTGVQEANNLPILKMIVSETTPEEKTAGYSVGDVGPKRTMNWKNGQIWILECKDNV